MSLLAPNQWEESFFSPTVPVKILNLLLIGPNGVMCPFLSQLIGRLESDKLVGGACAIGFLLKLEEWANLKT